MGGNPAECRLPVTEAGWLTGPDGPMFDSHGRPRAGRLTHLGGGLVQIDKQAMNTLRGLRRPIDDGRIEDVDGPEIVFGQDRYRVIESGGQ